MNGFTYAGHIWEFKSSRRGKGLITGRAVKDVLRDAKEVLRENRSRIRSFKFLFPINETSDESEVLIKDFSRQYKVKAKGYGEADIQNVVDFFKKTDKELYRMILQAIKVTVESEKDDGE